MLGSLCIVSLLCVSAAYINDWIYVFAYSWTPEFCYGNNYPGCVLTQPEYWETHFTIHGLWPQYIDGGYPSYCTNVSFDATSIETAIGLETLEKYWPNVQEDTDNANYTSFWEHEWSKHGTCTGLSQIDYFNQTVALIQRFGTPLALTYSVGKTINSQELIKDLAGFNSTVLLCNDNYLSGAYTCWNQFNSIPTNITYCPEDVLRETTCVQDTIYVQAIV